MRVEGGIYFYDFTDVSSHSVMAATSNNVIWFEAPFWWGHVVGFGEDAL